MNNASAGTPNHILLNAKSLEDRDLIVKTFKDNEVLLKALVVVLLNISPTDEQKAMVVGLAPEVKELIKARFYPKLNADYGLGLINDVWLGLEEDIKSQPDFVVRQNVLVQLRANELTEESLKSFEDVAFPGVDLSVDVNSVYGSDPLQTKLLGRNKFIRHINSQVYLLKRIADEPVKTPAQLAKDAKSDSVQ